MNLLKKLLPFLNASRILLILRILRDRAWNPGLSLVVNIFVKNAKSQFSKFKSIYRFLNSTDFKDKFLNMYKYDTLKFL